METQGRNKPKSLSELSRKDDSYSVREEAENLVRDEIEAFTSPLMLFCMGLAGFLALIWWLFL